MRRIVSLMAMVLVSTLLGTTAPAGAAEVQRRSGGDRISTAVEVSRAGWERSGTALLATAYAFPDALAASALAAKLDAPLLLTTRDALPAAVGAELQRLGADEVVILGGAAAVSDDVAEAVGDLPSSPSVRRIAGAGRWETAAQAAVEAGAPGGEAIVVSGENYPDAVSAGALTMTPSRPPVLLTSRDRLAPATRDALVSLDVERVVVIGGTAAVDQPVVDELRAMGLLVRRLSGDSRFSTSVAVAREALRRVEGAVPVVFATGQNFPDALSAGALASRVGGPVVLVPADGSGERLDAFLRGNAGRWEDSTVVGGTAAINGLGIERLRRAVNDLAPVELAEGRTAIAAWFRALDGRDYATLRERSSGPAALYADFIARLADATAVGSSSHRIVVEPTSARSIGGGAYALDMEVEWTPGGQGSVTMHSFSVREHPSGVFTVETFLRGTRPLSAYILDGSAGGGDDGEITFGDIRWFRRADQAPHDLTMLVRVTNRRSDAVRLDDDAAGLRTAGDGRSYTAGMGQFPEIPAGATRDVVLRWDDVPRSDAGASGFVMVYGPGRDREYENLVEFSLPAWPRA